MRPMRTEKGSVVFAAALVLSLLALLFLTLSGFFSEQFSDPRTWEMFAELLVLFLLLFLTHRHVREPGPRYSLMLFEFCLFLWVHRIFLPVFVSGLWVLCLILAGEDVLLFSRRRLAVTGETRALRLCHDFLAGAALEIVLFCLLSGMHLGGPKIARLSGAGFAALAVLLYLFLRLCHLFPPVFLEEAADAAGRRDAGAVAEKGGPSLPGTVSAGVSSWAGRRKKAASGSLFAASVLTLLAIHAGRMNITLDHDSIHYGLRSFYILDNGRGFFENLGSVNAVYFYPKGLEILTLPLSGTPTYGFVLAFSFWCAVLFLLLVRDTAAAHFGRRAGNCAMLLCAAVPGIMNLSTSAKTDMITLLFQFLAVSDFMGAAGSAFSAAGSSVRAPHEAGGRGNSGFLRADSVLWALTSLAFTLCFKPTAIAFSGLLLLSGAAFLAEEGVRCRRNREMQAAAPAGASRADRKTGAGWKPRADRKTGAGGWRRAAFLLPVFLLVLAALAGVTLRTLHLTGYPLVTVFTGIWEKLGMHGKYPLAVQRVPNASAGGSAAENLLFFLHRLFLLLIAPAGEDALHIRIAWGAPISAVCLLAALPLPEPRAHTAAPATAAAEAPEERGGAPAASCLGVTLVVLLLFDALTLCLLYQVDGNYYNLTYALAVLCAVSRWRKRPGALMRSVFPAFFVSAFLVCLTNWAGARGFTEPKLNHYGFYDHVSDIEDQMILGAKEPIYRYLRNAARIRLLAMAEEPTCYLFPCVTESYTDVEGSGGNVALVKTLNDFKDYLEKAGITYLYTEDSFLADHARAEEIIRYMQEDGSISSVIRQEGNTLYEYQAGIRD